MYTIIVDNKYFLFCITTGSLSPPEQLHISGIDFSSRKLTFAWSSVAPDCPAIHYNILASNCGSCSTTTTNTTVTCTDVPTTGSTSCNFAVQTVVCGNMTGNISDPVIVNTGTSTDITEVYIVSISFLAAALVVIVVISVIVIVVILIRSKAKNTALELQLSNRAGRSITHMESMYEDVTGPLPPVSTISTQDNVAYGHTKSSTAAL